MSLKIAHWFTFYESYNRSLVYILGLLRLLIAVSYIISNLRCIIHQQPDGNSFLGKNQISTTALFCLCSRKDK